EAVRGKVQQCQPTPSRHNRFENRVDVLTQEDFPACEICPGDVRILANERDHLVGGQFVGWLASPDVARLAAILAPVREAEVQLDRRGSAVDRSVEKRDAEVSRTSERLPESAIRSHMLTSGDPALSLGLVN